MADLQWLPWPAKFTPGHVEECAAAAAFEVAAEWLGGVGFLFPDGVPDFIARRGREYLFRWPGFIVTAEIDEDADCDGERMVDRSTCVRVEVKRV